MQEARYQVYNTRTGKPLSGGTFKRHDDAEQLRRLHPVDFAIRRIMVRVACPDGTPLRLHGYGCSCPVPPGC